MDKSYIYRKHLRESLTYFLLAIGIIISSAIISFVGLVLSDVNKVNIPLLLKVCLIIFIIGIILLVEVLIIYFIFLRRFKFINVRLTDDAIIYSKNKNKKEIIIPYDDIVKIKFPSVKYTGGWVKIVYKGGKIRLTVVLENIGDFIYELKKILDDREKADIYREKKMFSFFKTASYSDESWKRLYENIKLHLTTYYLNIIITVILVVIDGSGENKNLIFISLFITFIGYIIGEIIIGSKVRKRIVNGEFKLQSRNTEFESKVIRRTSTYLTIGYIALVIILTVFR